jgi:signal transduction histidine kinase
VPFLCDFCALLNVEHKEFKVKSVCHRDKDLIKLVHDTVGYFFAKAELTPYNPEMPANKQKPILIAEVTEAFLHSISQNEEHFQNLKILNPRSFLTVPLISRGELIGILFMGMNQSERIFSESDISFAELVAVRFAIVIDNARLYQKSQSAIRAREEILSVVSHDLKNPLSTIKSSSLIFPQLITEAGSKAEAERFSSIIQQKIIQMERLIHDLLDFAKIEAGNLSIVVKEESVNKLIEKVMEDFSAKAKEKSIKLESFVPSTELICVFDEGRIIQVLSNLIGNSLKFTPENGKITVAAENRIKDVLFQVQDNGLGISPELKDRIFERFLQAEKTAHMGTGLGLSIAKGIVEAHNGKIWLDSEEGKGTIFYFTLPKRH